MKIITEQLMFRASTTKFYVMLQIILQMILYTLAFL